MSGSMNDPTTPAESRALLTFTLNGQTYGVDVRAVREVVPFTGLIPVLHAPEFIRGVIDLRGTALPVMDLRLHEGLPPTEGTADSRIIVMELVVDGTAIVVGILADSVEKVVELPQEGYEHGLRIGTTSNTGFIRAWARRLTTS